MITVAEEGSYADGFRVMVLTSDILLENLLERLMLWFHPRQAESQILGWSLEIHVLTSPPGDSHES